MKAEWPTLTLRNAGVSLLDCEHRTPPAVRTGHSYVAIPQIKHGRLDLDAARKITQEHFEQWTRKALPRSYDVVLSRRCNPGETAFVPPRVQFALGQNLVLLRADGSNLFPPFLRWIVRGPAWWNQIRTFLNVGAVFDSLKCADIPNFRLPVPPLHEQRAIAAILGSLDDKIELNRRMNRTLEQMAAAIFKAWFVDFEPVKAKAAGAKRFPSMGQEVFDALPTQFTDSPLGPIPMGWKHGTIKEQCSLVMGQSPKSEFYNEGGEGLPFHQGVRGFGGRFPTHGTHCTVANRLAESGDILFSVRAPVGRINVADRRMIVGRGLAAIRHRHDTQSFLLYALKHQFQKEDAIGTGTIFASVTKKDMEDISILEPCDGCLQAFEGTAGALDQRYASNVRESATLAAIRDGLLPKLLSGEVRVGEAERIAGRAV